MTHDEDILLLRTLSALWRVVLWVDDVQCDQILYYRYLNSACVWAYACVFAGQETMTVDESPPRNQGYTTTITELDWTLDKYTDTDDDVFRRTQYEGWWLLCGVSECWWLYSGCSGWFIIAA